MNVRYLCGLTGAIMHVPVRLREDRDGFPVGRGRVCEKKTLFKAMRESRAFAGLTTSELRALLEPVSYLGEEIHRDMRDQAETEVELELTYAGKHLAAWRVNRRAVYTKIQGLMPWALHLQAHPDELRDVHAFMDARCQGDMWRPRDEDIEMAAEISRWHTRKDIQGNMHRALATALDLPGSLLSVPQKDLSREGYFHAMESHWNTEDHGGQDVWILNGVRWCKMELAKQDWDGEVFFQNDMIQTVAATLGGGVLSESERQCVRNGYALSVEHCEYNDTSARVDWAVNWAVTQITESRAKTNASHQAMVDESLRNEARQSRKRAREEHLERQKDMKRLIREAPSMSRKDVLEKLVYRRERFVFVSAMVYGTPELEFAYKPVMGERERYEKEVDDLLRGRAV